MRLGVRAAIIATVGIIFWSGPSPQAEPEHVHGCMPPAQAREVLIAQKFVAPFRAVEEAVRAQNGEVVGIQLCLSGTAFVYDVTLLRRDGRVPHVLVDAHSGAVLGAPHGK